MLIFLKKNVNLEFDTGDIVFQKNSISKIAYDKNLPSLKSV